MVERSGQFRVYRIVDTVPQINLQSVAESRLYTAYESGYGDRQPAVAVDLWDDGATEPRCAVLTEGGERVGVCCVQPREPLPNGGFVPNVLTGLLPLETRLAAVPEIGEPAAEALFLDPDPPDASAYSRPYGVVLLFTDGAEGLPDRFRAAYDCPRGEDTRPAFDPYGL